MICIQWVVEFFYDKPAKWSRVLVEKLIVAWLINK